MTRQPDPTAEHTDVTAADLEVPPDAVPSTSNPDSFADDGLGAGDGPDVHAPADSGN